MELQYGGTNKEIIDLFSQNINTICIFRFKSPFSNFSGQQYTGKLIDIYNALHRFDPMQNASIILNGTEYEGTIGLIQKYLHEAKIISDMVRSGMLAAAGPKYIPYNMMNVPLNKLFKTFGNELITKFHLLRESTTSENKIEIISLLTNFRDRLSMVSGDQYVNLKLLCDNAIIEINNINDNPIINYIQEVKNQITKEAGNIAFQPILAPINDCITNTIGSIVTLTASSVHGTVDRIRKYYRNPVPRPNLNNLTVAEIIYMEYYDFVETVLKITLDAFGEIGGLGPVQKETAIISGVDAILLSYGNTPINNMLLYGDHTLCVLFGAPIPGGTLPGVPIPNIRNLFLYINAYDFLGELCQNKPVAVGNMDVLTRYILEHYLSTPLGKLLILDGLTVATNVNLAAAYGNALFNAPARTFSQTSILEIFDGISSLDVNIAEINDMHLLYVIIIASRLFKLIYNTENDLEHLNRLSVNIPVSANVHAIIPPAVVPHPYANYSDLFGPNGTRRLAVAGNFVAASNVFSGIPPIPLVQGVTTGLLVPIGIPPAPVPPAPRTEIHTVKNQIMNDLRNEIYLSILIHNNDVIDPTNKLHDAINNMFDIIYILKDKNTNTLIISSIIENIKKINNKIKNISDNLLNIGTNLQTTHNDIVSRNNAVENIVILPPANVNIFSKEIELLLNQLSIM